MEARLRLEERILTGIELGESHFREFKSAYQRTPDGLLGQRPLKDICRNIGEVLVAFVNADGGELFIGVENDGTISGIPHKPEHIEAMKNSYIAYVHPETPLPPPVVRFITADEKMILYFQVSKSTTHVHLTSEGRCLQRFDRENRPVSAERIQYERQEAVSREYDRSFVTTATVQDLDVELVDSIAQHLAPGYSPEKFLQLFDLAEYDAEGLSLRRAALLLFAKDIVRWHPRCAVRILRVVGTEVGIGRDFAKNVMEDDMISANIVTILESAWDRLRPHLARTRFQPNALFRESIIFPEEACREALINAVAHRDYSLEGKPIEVIIFDDRMEVQSPGRLLSSISIDDLKELRGAHQSRNVFVARVLRELGYMREMGEGIRRIFTSVRKFELVDPEIHSDQNLFTVTLFHKSIFSPKDVEWLNSFSEFYLTKDEQRVVLLGRDGRLLSTNDIIGLLGIVDTEDFRALYERLNRKGIIYRAKQANVRRQKRSVPRFQIRPPNESQQYLVELQSALVQVGPTDHFDRNASRKLREYLSKNSPYYREPVLALRALDYVSELYAPLPRLQTIWSRSIEDYAVAEAKRQTAEDYAVAEAKRQTAKVVTLFNVRGFGFARTLEGEDFFLHVANFSDRDDWEKLSIGSVVNFRTGERQIPGKAKLAVDIKFLR